MKGFRVREEHYAKLKRKYRHCQNVEMDKLPCGRKADAFWMVEGSFSSLTGGVRKKYFVIGVCGRHDRAMSRRKEEEKA
jgi:hypothetical protein